MPADPGKEKHNDSKVVLLPLWIITFFSRKFSGKTADFCLDPRTPPSIIHMGTKSFIRTLNLCFSWMQIWFSYTTTEKKNRLLDNINLNGNISLNGAERKVAERSHRSHDICRISWLEALQHPSMNITCNLGNLLFNVLIPLTAKSGTFSIWLKS